MAASILTTPLPGPRGRAFIFQSNRAMHAGWIIVVRIKLLNADRYAESSPFAVAVEDQDGAIEVVRKAFPLKEGLTFAALEPLSVRDVEILGLRQGEFRVRWKRQESAPIHEAAGQPERKT
ncbi:MAG TPA: hypothetical protein VJT13_18480 [Xanthobacteraceae bacterium]|nr:hypothetical protein [Xanthobacteraceae bacterium]